MSYERENGGGEGGEEKATRPPASANQATRGGPPGVGEGEVKEGAPPPGMGLASRDSRDRGPSNSGYGGGRSAGRGGPRHFRGGGFRGGRGGRGGRGDYDRERPGRGGGGGRHSRVEGTVESIQDVFPADQTEDEGGAPAQAVSYEGWIVARPYHGRGGPSSPEDHLSKFHFKQDDVMGKAKLAVGDKVEFYKYDSGQGQVRATRVRSLADRELSRKKRDQAAPGLGPSDSRQGAMGVAGTGTFFFRGDGRYSTPFLMAKATTTAQSYSLS